MSRADIRYYVSGPDETAAKTGNLGSYIPTLGAPATAIDAYRILGVGKTNLNDYSVAVTDVASVAALERLAVGEIRSWHDLIAAETALAVLLLYDEVNVVTWAPKVERNGFIGYHRTDTNLRGLYSHKLMSLASSNDWLIAPELVRLDKRLTSTLRNSPLADLSPFDIQSINEENYWNDAIRDSVTGTLAALEVPAFLSDPRIAALRSRDDFQRRLYHSLGVSWKKHFAPIPLLNVGFEFPPFLAIVLDRMGVVADRGLLSDIIAELRSELAAVRQELFRLNSSVMNAVEQKDLEAMCREVEASFAAIVPEARLSNAARTRRSIARVFRIVLPVKNLFAALHAGRTSLSEIGKLSSEMEAAILTKDKLVDRTITARSFSDLLETFNTVRRVYDLFSPAERQAIAASAPRKEQ